jgi:hypothetical protein
MEDDFVHRANGEPYFGDYDGMGRRMNALVFGSIGALAGYKFYERWKPYASTAAVSGAALRHGAYMAIRWKAWTVTALWWILTTPIWAVLASGILDTALDQDPTNWNFDYPPRDVNITEPWFQGSLALVWAIFALHIIIGFFAVGATYTRAIRESDFQRRRFYIWMWPFELLVRRVDWKILHSLVVLPVALAIISYNQ